MSSASHLFGNVHSLDGGFLKNGNNIMSDNLESVSEDGVYLTPLLEVNCDMFRGLLELLEQTNSAAIVECHLKLKIPKLVQPERDIIGNKSALSSTCFGPSVSKYLILLPNLQEEKLMMKVRIK
jgi:hypothetical protein